MYIVGIDIGKNHHEASIVSPEGKQIGRSLRFATTHKGADSLMSFIFKNIGNSPCVFGMEATGHYWYPIYSFLKAKGYTIYVINPIQSDSLRKMYIRQTKNDSIDSFLIAEVIRFGQFTTTSMADENILAMRQLCRYRDSAADTFGIKIAQDAFSFQLKQLIDRMNFLDKQIEALDCQILEYYEKFDCYLHTIPGIGMIAAATTCSFHNSPLNAYYKKKREQGKHHLTATGAVARKLTTIIYAVFRDGKPYEPKKFC